MELFINTDDENKTTMFSESSLESTDLPENEEDIYEGILVLAKAGQHCNEYELGGINGVPETKTEWERQCVGPRWARVCTRVPVVYTRTSRTTLHARICLGLPSNDEIWNIVRSCAFTSLGVSIAAAIANPALAWPAFKITLKICLEKNWLCL